MNSPFSTLFLAIQTQLADLVPAVKWIDQDLGQLELERPPVNYPCLLVDFDEFKYDDAGEAIQFAEGFVSIRLAFQAWSNTNSVTPSQWKEKGLSFYDIEWAVYKALHGWKPEKYGYLMRVSANTEQREDNLRVRVLRFSINFEDFSACKEYSSAHLPPPVVDAGFTT